MERFAFPDAGFEFTILLCLSLLSAGIEGEDMTSNSEKE